MIEIKTFLGEWKKVTPEQAEAFYQHFYNGSTAIKTEDKNKYFNENHTRGGHIFYSGKVETSEEQKERMFNSYKNDLSNLSNDKRVRFITVEYVCSFPKINPYIMAASLVKEGIEILFDDSSINLKENRIKERKVYKLVQ
ncbi:MAG: hypothetical protein LUH21_04165 [Clostridiales bacterium]|nr:hypothetical protein [Clostridiales bacterium]